MQNYKFSNKWFQRNKTQWDFILEQSRPKKYLEVGSYEGRSVIYFMDSNVENKWHQEISVYCVDQFKDEQKYIDRNLPPMEETEKTFDDNINISLAKSYSYGFDVDFHKIKEPSNKALVRLLNEGHRSTFDMVYIDGSHEASDVMTDAVLGYELCAKGGIIVFDNHNMKYSCDKGVDPIQCAKISIDAFELAFCRKLKNIEVASSFQRYYIKR